MKRLLDEKIIINPEIKHILKLQTLLTEFDRENKFLSKQVISLLHQNQQMKKQKLRNTIIFGSNSFVDSRYKLPHHSRSFLNNNIQHQAHTKSLNQQIKHTKIKTDPQESHSQENTIGFFPKNTMISKNSYLADSDINAYSFGENTNRDKLNEEEIFQEKEGKAGLQNQKQKRQNKFKILKNIEIKVPDFQPHTSTIKKITESRIIKTEISERDRESTQKKSTFERRNHSINPSPNIINTYTSEEKPRSTVISHEKRKYLAIVSKFYKKDQK